MAVYKGVLKMVGTSRDEGLQLGVVYSVIEIGDDAIRNVQVSDVLDSYLRGAIGKDIEVSCHIRELSISQEIARVTSRRESKKGWL